MHRHVYRQWKIWQMGEDKLIALERRGRGFVKADEECERILKLYDAQGIKTGEVQIV